MALNKELKKDISIKDRFEEYVQTIFEGKVKPGSQQYIEIRRAFMGGALVLVELMKSVLPELEEDEAVEALTHIDNEIKSYWKREVDNG